MTDIPAIKLNLIKKKTELEPSNPEHWVDLGDYLCEELSLYEEAIDAYNKASELLPSSDFSLRIGECLIYDGKMRKGIKMIKESISSNPRAEGFIFLAESYIFVEDFPKAKESLLEAIRLDETSEEAYTLLAELEESKKAIELYKRAISLNPKYYEAWIGLGKEELRNSNFKKAIDAFKKGIKLNSQDIWSFLYLANAYWSIDDIENAKENYSIAIQLDPNSEEAKKWYSDFLESIGEVERSKQIINISSN